MPVTLLTPAITHSGDGVQTVFEFTYRVDNPATVRVAYKNVADDVRELEADEYTVTLASGGAGGTVQLLSLVPALNETVALLRETPIDQLVGVTRQTAYDPSVVMGVWDKLTMIAQEHNERLGRAVLVPPGMAGGALAEDLAKGILRLTPSADNIDAVAERLTEIGQVSGAIGHVTNVSQHMDAVVAASGSLLALVDQSYVASLDQTVFALPALAPADENVLVWVDGVRKVPGVDYTTVGTELHLATAPADGVAIDVLVITAVSSESIELIYDEFKKATVFQQQTFLTVAGQTRYTRNSSGELLNLTQTNHAAFGGSPYGPLTYGVDYVVSDRGFDALFVPGEGELITILSMPRFTNEEAQALLQDYKDDVEADRLAAEAAAAAALAVPLRTFPTYTAARGAVESGALNSAPDGAMIWIDGTPIIKQTGTDFMPGMPGWRPTSSEVDVRVFTDSWAVDVGPGMRLARDYLAAIGGGVIRLRGRNNVLSSMESTTVVSVGATSFTPAAIARAGVVLPRGISLQGDVGRKSKLKFTPIGSTPYGPIMLRDWGDAFVDSLEIEGGGITNTAQHGIAFTTSYQDYVCSDFVLSNLFIHTVGSYGIGYQYGIPVRSLVKNVVIHDTGADGVDWKVRGSSTDIADAQSVVFDNIEVRRFGLRVGYSNSSGFGLRGSFTATKLRVYEIQNGSIGIIIDPGINNPTNADHRRSAHNSILNDWYCEGVRLHGSTACALQVWAVEGCQVGPGVARWCQVKTTAPTVSPYHSLGGSTIAGVTVIPNANTFAVLLEQENSRVDVDVLCDSDLFALNRGTATLGQTVFAMPEANNASGLIVLKNKVKLTLGTDYTVSGVNVTMAEGIGANDSIFLVYPPVAAVRVNTLYCVVSGTADRWCSRGVFYATQPQADTGSHFTFVWHGRAGNLTLTNSDTVLGISSNTGNLRLGGSGPTGVVELNRPRGLNVPTSPAGLASGLFWRDPAADNVIKIVP